MFDRSRQALAALFTAALLAGCVAPPQAPVTMGSDYFTPGKAKTNRIGVVMADLPKPDTAFPGAFCLLCIAVANAAHSALSAHVQTFSTAELKPLPGELVAAFKARGQDAVLIDGPLDITALPNLSAPADGKNKARKDFSSFKTKHGVDRLLVVHFSALGVWRSYSAYVPTDPPRAVVNGTVQLVDLGTNTLDWYLPLDFSRAADGAWDEPPKFPGLSNAYYQVLETTLDAIRKPLAKQP